MIITDLSCSWALKSSRPVTVSLPSPPSSYSTTTLSWFTACPPPKPCSRSSLTQTNPAGNIVSLTSSTARKPSRQRPTLSVRSSWTRWRRRCRKRRRSCWWRRPTSQMAPVWCRSADTRSLFSPRDTACQCTCWRHSTSFRRSSWPSPTRCTRSEATRCRSTCRLQHQDSSIVSRRRSIRLNRIWWRCSFRTPHASSRRMSIGSRKTISIRKTWPISNFHWLHSNFKKKIEKERKNTTIFTEICLKILQVYWFQKSMDLIRILRKITEISWFKALFLNFQRIPPVFLSFSPPKPIIVPAAYPNVLFAPFPCFPTKNPEFWWEILDFSTFFSCFPVKNPERTPFL